MSNVFMYFRETEKMEKIATFFVFTGTLKRGELDK